MFLRFVWYAPSGYGEESCRTRTEGPHGFTHYGPSSNPLDHHEQNCAICITRRMHASLQASFHGKLEP